VPPLQRPVDILAPLELPNKSRNYKRFSGGRLDIVIGTWSINNVVFKSLGLLIVDEEQKVWS
jgi:transcription-repair coupling factor (superfamily II helicase)